MKKLGIVILLAFVGLISCKNEKLTIEKGKYMWFDCEANFERLSNPDSVEYYLKKIKSYGFNNAVVDVKSIMGETLFKSKYAPYMKEWRGVEREEQYDMLATFIDKAEKLGINIYASANVFAGGHNYHDRGVIYSDKEKSEWQSVNYWFEGGDNGIRKISTMKWNYNGLMNPALPQVQEYQINIIKELVGNYPKLKGIILDRVRYDGITADFSEFSHKAFEKYAGLEVEKFPQDILYWEKDKSGNWQWKRGQHFNKWVEWRAKIIHDFIARLRKELKAINPDLVFGDYTGAWYPVYYETGVNWASKKYDPSKKYDWATADYKNFGYAEQLDLWMGGMYFREVTIDEVHKMNEEAMKNRTEAAMGKGREDWYSVEGCSNLAHELICGDVPICGSILVSQYKNPEQFRKAMKMAYSKNDALMLFDICHIISNNWWEYLK